VKGASSGKTTLKCGVPQGSVLGPILFNLYTSSLGCLLRDCGVHYHIYADDTQIYLSAPPNQLDDAIMLMEECLLLVRSWMHRHKLMMNDEKTEMLYISSKHNAQTFTEHSIAVGDTTVSPSGTVRNIGAIFDHHLDMNTFVSSIQRYHNLYLP
jgi:hypothetical protein